MLKYNVSDKQWYGGEKKHINLQWAKLGHIILLICYCAIENVA